MKDANYINDMFLQKLDDPSEVTKLAQETQNYVRTKIRESSFARKILPPQIVTKADLQRSVQHDGMVKIVDKEPDSSAMVVNFRGNPNSEYVMGERYEIPLFGVTSPDYEKIEEELLAYNIPIHQIIEKNSVFDIHEQEDKKFLTLVENAITSEVAKGNDTSVTGNYDSTTGEIPKSSLVELFDTLDGNKLETSVLLMDNTMYNKLNLSNASTVGDQVASTVMVDGYKYPTVLGKRVIVSNKGTDSNGDDLLKNKIYAFTSPEFFGEFDILNDTKFWIKKEKNLVRWAIYEWIGMGIGNTAACASLTLSAAE